MKLGHEQAEVDLKYLDCVSIHKHEPNVHHNGFWQVKITMLDARTYHENFESVTNAADRVIEVRDWKIIRLEDKLDDLISILGTAGFHQSIMERIDSLQST